MGPKTISFHFTLCPSTCRLDPSSAPWPFLLRDTWQLFIHLLNTGNSLDVCMCEPLSLNFQIQLQLPAFHCPCCSLLSHFQSSKVFWAYNFMSRTRRYSRLRSQWHILPGLQLVLSSPRSEPVTDKSSSTWQFLGTRSVWGSGAGSKRHEDQLLVPQYLCLVDEHHPQHLVPNRLLGSLEHHHLQVGILSLMMMTKKMLVGK